MLTIMDSKTLILGAKEDSADDVARQEQEEESVMPEWVVICVENGQ